MSCSSLTRATEAPAKIVKVADKVQALSGRGHPNHFHNTILKYCLHMYQYLASPQVGTTLPPAPITQPPSSTSSSSQGQARERL